MNSWKVNPAISKENKTIGSKDNVSTEPDSAEKITGAKWKNGSKVEKLVNNTLTITGNGADSL